MKWHRTRRRPVWQPSRLSRLKSFLRSTLGRITLGRLALAILILPLLFYVYREVTRDVLIIDPFSVPKRFEEAGITGDVIANRIGDKFHQIEVATQTRMKKDNLTSLREGVSVPDVEIPGTKFGLKTLVDITRAVFGIYPKHISGDVVFPVDTPDKVGSPPEKQQARVTVYLTQGRDRSAGVTVEVPADGLELLVQSTAETALGQVNPYVLAAYRADHLEYDKAIEIVERIIQDPAEDILHKKAACNLWGNVLDDQKKYDEAIAKYQKAIELDPKYADAYNGWGTVLGDQKKPDEAIAKYQKAIELNPKIAFAYNNWGIVLREEGKYDEAIAKYQKAIELDPKYADAYNGWGTVLADQKKPDEAIAKYQKAIELDPKVAFAYNNWGIVLREEGKYDEANAKFQKARELSPSQ
jgi:Tfp pilus assembly protein PilF